MSRMLLLIAIIACVFGLAASGYVVAQEASTPTAELCATPTGSPVASPTLTGTGTPTAANPCASPTAESGGAVSGGAAVTLVDIAFQPTTLTIAANTEVVITLPNSGALTHNFNIDELNIHSGDIQGGSQTTVTINAAPGTYTYYCNIPGHKELGMVGQLTVK